jgi:uncharacterized protein DUF6174
MQRIAFLTTSTLLLVGCATYQMSERTIARAEASWTQAGVISYSFELRINAFMPPSKCEEMGVIAVVVRRSQLVSYGKCAAPPHNQENLASIPGLFQMMRESKGAGAPGVVAKFDAKYAFPRRIEIVFRRWATDSTVTYYVENFQPGAE